MNRMETAEQVRKPLDFGAETSNVLFIASLPKNSASLAVQAEQAGVDAVVFSVEGDENGFPGHFGTFELHEAYIKDAVSTLSIPSGIFIGGARPLTPGYWESIISTPFAFVEMFAHQMPLFVHNDSRVEKLLAISTGYILEQVRVLSELPGTDAIEVAVVPPQARGNPFSALDYATVMLISKLSRKPVLLRTQKRIAASDIFPLTSLGIKGFVIDPSIASGADEAYRLDLETISPRRESE